MAAHHLKAPLGHPSRTAFVGYYGEHAAGTLSHNCFYAICSENNMIVSGDIQYWQFMRLFKTSNLWSPMIM